MVRKEFWYRLRVGDVDVWKCFKETKRNLVRYWTGIHRVREEEEKDQSRMKNDRKRIWRIFSRSFQEWHWKNLMNLREDQGDGWSQDYKVDHKGIISFHEE